MKSIRCIISLMAASLFLSLPLSYANHAPVEDLSTESAQQNADPASRMDSANAPQEDDQETQYQQEQSSDSQSSDIANDDDSSDDDDISSQSDSASEAVADDGTVSSTASGNQGTEDDRLARLEQQMSNMTTMNLPQQIAELRQEVQQLTGRIQVQQHDIKILENQQRNFYQDLNRRVQQVANVNTTSSTQKKQNHPNVAKLKATNAGLKESEAYRLAFNLLVKKQYDKALNAFQDYVHHYPRGDFVANAYYWIGELYLKENDAKLAIQSFRQVIFQYPNSNKVPDAKLKLAIVHISQNKIVQARQELLMIKKHYPNSTAAQLASIQLQRMEQ